VSVCSNLLALLPEHLGPALYLCVCVTLTLHTGALCYVYVGVCATQCCSVCVCVTLTLHSGAPCCICVCVCDPVLALCVCVCVYVCCVCVCWQTCSCKV